MVQGIMGNLVIWETSNTNDRGVSATWRGKKTCKEASRSNFKVRVKGHGCCTDLKGVGSLFNIQTHQKYQVRTQKTAFTLHTIQL